MVPLALILVQVLGPGPSGLRVDAYGDPLPLGAVARFGSIRWLCPDSPEHLIWSPDGKYLVGTHGVKSLTIWAYPDGVIVGRFEIPQPVRGRPARDDLRRFGPAITARHVRFSRDCQSMVVYAGENQLFRVSVPDGRWERIDTRGHPGTAMAVSANARRLLFEVPDDRKDGDRWSVLSVLDLGRPGQVRGLWNRPVMSRSDRGLMGFSDQAVCDAQMTPDGRFVVASAVWQYWERFVVFDLATGRSGATPWGLLRDMAISPDGQSFLAVDHEYRLTRWAFTRGGGPSAHVAGLVAQSPDARHGPWHFSPDGRLVVTVGSATGGRDRPVERAIAVLDTATLRPLREWNYRPGDLDLARGDKGSGVARGGHGVPTWAVAPDNRTLAVASSDSPRIRFFDLSTGKEVLPFVGHAAAVTAIRSAGVKVVSAGSDGSGRVWESVRAARAGGRRPGREAEVFEELSENDLPPQHSARARVKVLYDRDRNHVEARDVESEVVVWELDVSGQILAPQPSRPKSLPTAVDRDGDCVAFAAGEMVSLRDLSTGEPLTDLRVAGLWPTAVEFGPDPHTLVVGYHDGQILVWDVRPADLPRRAPTAAEMKALWADLAGSPRAAARARTVFFEHPQAALAWLGANLRALPRPTEYDIDLWLAQLAHPRFAVREEATRHLVRHFDVAGPAVRGVLAVTRSPEMEHRLRTIVETHARWGGDGDVVRLVRVVAILERIGTPEARELVSRVARGGGVPAARATETLVRLREREMKRPANKAKAAVVHSSEDHTRPE